jgi:hypothetical protein
VAAGIAAGKAADENCVEDGAGYDTELSKRRNFMGEDPVGDPDSHSSLNQPRQLQSISDLLAPVLGPTLDLFS